MKIFITGVYGSGKTFLAQNISKEKNVPYICFDDHFDYQSNEEQFDWIMSLVPESFIMDAIPFDYSEEDYSWRKFINYQMENQCQIICCYCPDKAVWIDRIIKHKGNVAIKIRFVRRFKIIRNLGAKAPKRVLQSAIHSLWHYFKTLPNNRSNLDPKTFYDTHYFHYDRFHLENFPLLLKMRNVTFFDSIANEYTAYSEALKRINSAE